MLSSNGLENFNHAVALAHAGEKLLANDKLRYLAQLYPNQPDILIWLAFTAPTLREAEEAINRVAIIQPNYPSLPDARSWLARQKTEQKEVRLPVPQISPPTNNNTTWTFVTENQGQQRIDLETSRMLGIKEIHLNGVLYRKLGFFDSPMLPGDVRAFPFEIDGHEGTIRQQSTATGHTYEVTLDGYYLRNGRPAYPLQRLPIWVWFFLLVCVAACLYGVTEVFIYRPSTSRTVNKMLVAVPIVFGMFSTGGLVYLLRRVKMPLFLQIAACCLIAGGIILANFLFGKIIPGL